jgi:hypothetical protein
MPRDLLALPSFTCRTRCSSALLLLLELASTAALLVLYSLAALHRTTLLLNCLVGIASIVCGFLVRRIWNLRCHSSLMTRY